MMRIAHTVDSRPVANPDRMTVAGPVTEDSAMSLTGLRVVEVKCSVRTWMRLARTRPMNTAQNTRRSPTYDAAKKTTPTADAAADRKNPRLMAFIPCSVSLRGDTA